MKTRVASAVWVSFMMLLSCIALPALAGEKLSFSKTTVEKLAAGKAQMTRVVLTGYVTYVAKEADGDIHFRVCNAASVKGVDKTNCIVAEIMPGMPLPAPKVGQKVTVKGITRFDGEHKWYEIHPVQGVQ